MLRDDLQKMWRDYVQNMWRWCTKDVERLYTKDVVERLCTKDVEIWCTVVPATAGQCWFRGKMALRGRWPLVTGNGHMRHYVKSNTHIYFTANAQNFKAQRSITVLYTVRDETNNAGNVWKVNSNYSQCNAFMWTHTCAVLYFKICRSNRRRFEMSHGDWPL